MIKTNSSDSVDSGKKIPSTTVKSPEKQQRKSKSEMVGDDHLSRSSIAVGIHRPKTFQPSQADFNLKKYSDMSLGQIYLDPRPRIRNIVRELEDEHEWSWPPPYPKDFEKARLAKRKKCSLLYAKECLDLSTYLSLIIGPLELLVALTFTAFPKTFIPAMRESSEFCILFVSIFIIEGLFHTYAAILGLGLQSVRPYMIGFAFPSWPFEFVLPLVGIFVLFIAFFTTQSHRILSEMTVHLKGYNYRWYSKEFWDRYQSLMRCCGINGYKDWAYHGPILEDNGHVSTVPESCCREPNCTTSATPDVYEYGCYYVTELATNIFLSLATICMIVAILLSIIGYRCMREAEDFVGDPGHDLIFNHNSAPSLKKQSKAGRREELFYLLNYYCLALGEELGMDQDVLDAKRFLGISSQENIAADKPGPVPKTQKSQPSDEIPEVATSPKKNRYGILSSESEAAQALDVDFESAPPLYSDDPSDAVSKESLELMRQNEIKDPATGQNDAAMVAPLQSKKSILAVKPGKNPAESSMMSKTKVIFEGSSTAGVNSKMEVDPHAANSGSRHSSIVSPSEEELIIPKEPENTASNPRQASASASGINGPLQVLESRADLLPKVPSNLSRHPDDIEINEGNSQGNNATDKRSEGLESHNASDASTSTRNQNGGKNWVEDR